MNWPDIPGKVACFVLWLTRRRHQETFSMDIEETNSFKTLVESIKCPACGQNTFRLVKFSRGRKGWQAIISCKNCQITGAANSEGFSFDNLDQKGSATR